MNNLYEEQILISILFFFSVQGNPGNPGKRGDLGAKGKPV